VCVCVCVVYPYVLFLHFKQNKLYTKYSRNNLDIFLHETACLCTHVGLEDNLDSLLKAVSTVLWGHLSANHDQLITYLRQMLLDNVVSNANQDSQLEKRWKLHNDVVVNGDLTFSASTPVYYHYFLFYIYGFMMNFKVSQRGNAGFPSLHIFCWRLK